MREAKFRGKSKDNGKWEYGDFIRLPEDSGSYYEPPSAEQEFYIASLNYLARDFIRVIPETVGQYTGMKDKNDKEIYEGDIIRQEYKGGGAYSNGMPYHGFHIGEVVIIPSKGVCMKNPLHFKEYSEHSYKTTQYKNVVSYRCEKIGNIYDNPEMLGDTK